jgi:dimethylhistidine N-methyltransferase
MRFAADVRRGLAQMPKRLNCCWFYDEIGSRLFEEICDLPEYYLTRAEDEILHDHADAVVARMPVGTTLVELGSGSATKTRRLIDALFRRQRRLRYLMIDISSAALAASAQQLRAAYPGLDVVPVTAEYDDGLAGLDEHARAPRLVLWLGSNVGNLHRQEAIGFLARVRARLQQGDRLLVGIDRRKDRRVLESAYDDAAGVTARFNLNLLARLNRELGASFDLAGFRHRVRFDEWHGRIEMWLVSIRPQRVRIDRLGLTVEIAAGEAIHTEDSYKYSDAEIETLARESGHVLQARWLDREQLFSDNLLAPAGSGA